MRHSKVELLLSYPDIGSEILDRWIDYDAKHPQEYQLQYAMYKLSLDCGDVPNVQIIPGARSCTSRFHWTAVSLQFGILFKRANTHVLLDMMEKFYVHYQTFRLVAQQISFF